MAKAPTALITGITGQDGSFLAELLLQEGYAVTGAVRRDPAEPLGSSEPLRDRIELIRADLLDPGSLAAAIQAVAADEIYHLAAPSFVPDSWLRPGETMRAIVGSCAAILETVREHAPQTRVFVAASGAMFGAAPESPQREDTFARPENPYAAAKLAAHQLVGLLRERDGLHASSGIVFNHESERRPEQFVTRRITRGAAAIALGRQEFLELGALDAVRDWSFAGDTMRGAWLMLRAESAGDYVLASGVGRTVADFARTAFACVGLDADSYVRVSSDRVRAPEATRSVGDPSRARELLGWRAEVSFEQLVARMVAADLRDLEAAAQPG